MTRAELGIAVVAPSAVRGPVWIQPWFQLAQLRSDTHLRGSSYYPTPK